MCCWHEEVKKAYLMMLNVLRSWFLTDSHLWLVSPHCAGAELVWAELVELDKKTANILWLWLHAWTHQSLSLEQETHGYDKASWSKNEKLHSTACRCNHDSSLFIFLFTVIAFFQRVGGTRHHHTQLYLTHRGIFISIINVNIYLTYYIFEAWKVYPLTWEVNSNSTLQK